MKVGLLTYHRAHNYGGVLQCYALQNYLIKNDIDCKVVDYRCEFLEKQYAPYSYRNIPPLKVIASIILKNGNVQDNTLAFEKFRKDHLILTEPVLMSEQLAGISREFDFLITGSDQVWSYFCSGFDKAYFLDFVDKPLKKISYAASFGVDSIPESLKGEYKGLLSTFNNISVREGQGAKIVKDILNEDVPVVLDPTFLLTRSDWEKITSNKYKEEKYLLLYLIVESQDTINLAKKLAKSKGLKILYITERLRKPKGIECVSCVSVNDWVDLFLNASTIVTNSFHGIAFSINFQKEFYVQNLPAPAKVNSRIDNILSILNLVERRVTDFETAKELNSVDFESVDSKLELLKAESKSYLLKAIR